MKKTITEVEFTVERAYSAYTIYMANHMERMQKFRQNGHINQETAHHFDFDRDLPLTKFKEFVAALPDHDSDFQIDPDGYNITISFYVKDVIVDGAIDKLRERAQSAITQFRHYLAASHVLYHMRNNGMDVIDEIEYNALYHPHLFQLTKSNVTPDGFNESFEVQK